VIRDAAGRYVVSFVVASTDEPLPESDSEVGIDLGLTHFAVCSDGTKVTAPKFLRRAAGKLKRLQQDLSRKQPGSANRKKAVVKVARAHARVADCRRDWQHKLSTTIIRDNQAVYVEDLCVAGLGRTRLAKSVHDAGWASFTAMLEYKAARYRRTFARVDRFFPSTRMCSACGRLKEKMTLNVRAWHCPCGSHHDRDVNAAKNIRAVGQADLNDRGAQLRPASVPAPRGEAVTHPDAAWSTRSVEEISVLRAGEDVNAPDTRFAATWQHDAPTGRCTASRTFVGTAGPVTIRCDGQANHGGVRHQGSRAGHPIMWASTG
jgi:putative transposase